VTNATILDASAVLAYFLRENGLEVVEAALDAGGSQMTTVNYCEVLGKLVEKGMPADEAEQALNELGITFVDFDIALAQHAALLQRRTRSIGASLGDRACVALAMQFVQSKATATVFTADQSWSRAKWPFKIVVIRTARTAN
jgi:PIN domain nuclease of toxin-antitoxin system